MRTLAHEAPGYLHDDDQLVSSNRQLGAPANLYRSQKHGSRPRFCGGCGGPWIAEIRGGPIVRHTFDCGFLP